LPYESSESLLEALREVTREIKRALAGGDLSNLNLLSDRHGSILADLQRMGPLQAPELLALLKPLKEEVHDLVSGLEDRKCSVFEQLTSFRKNTLDKMYGNDPGPTGKMERGSA
jgi:hypothetical protein